MDNSTKDYSNVHHLDRLVSALMALLPGLVIHSFIIGVNVSDWWKGRSVTPVDHIITSLGISRMGAQCLGTIYIFVETLSLIQVIDPITLWMVPSFINMIYYFFILVNIWLTSLLSIVLCLKISNLHTRLFLYLRRMISHRIVHVIVASVSFCAFSCLMPLLITVCEMSKEELYDFVKENLLIFGFNSMYTITIGAPLPLIFYSMSSILLFTSLYHHTTRMKMSSNLSINLDGYYSVMKLVSITFIYNSMYFTGHFIGAFLITYFFEHLEWLYIALDFLPFLHSSYLIYRTAKLRNQMSKVLHNVIRFLFQRRNTETRENIEIVAHVVE